MPQEPFSQALYQRVEKTILNRLLATGHVVELDGLIRSLKLTNAEIEEVKTYVPYTNLLAQSRTQLTFMAERLRERPSELGTFHKLWDWWWGGGQDEFERSSDGTERA